MWMLDRFKVCHPIESEYGCKLARRSEDLQASDEP